MEHCYEIASGFCGLRLWISLFLLIDEEFKFGFKAVNLLVAQETPLCFLAMVSFASVRYQSACTGGAVSLEAEGSSPVMVSIQFWSLAWVGASLSDLTPIRKLTPTRPAIKLV